MTFFALARAMGTATLIVIGTAAHAQDTTLRVASYAPEGDIIDRALVRLNEELMERTDGALGLQIYRSNALGSNREAIELTQQGAIDMAVAGAPHVSRFAPALGAVSFPYLWESREAMLEILSGDLGDRLAAAAEAQADGLKIMAWFETGFRHVTNSIRPIVKPEDIEGLKLRTTPTPVQIAFWRKLGAIPTAMDWSEVMPSLQQGVIDGQENPPSVVYPYKVYEFQEYYSLTAHSNEPTLLLMSEMSWDGLSDEHKAAMVDALGVVTSFEHEIAATYNGEIMEELEKVIQVNVVPDATRAKFREVAGTVYEEGMVSLQSDEARAVVEAIMSGARE